MDFAKIKNLGKKDFTLLELLLVIAVIAILASMLLPALKNARETAQMINCQSNQKQTGLALLMYANDSNAWIPLATGYNTSHPHGPWGEILVSENYSNWNTLHCPSSVVGPSKGNVQWEMGNYTYGMRYYTTSSNDAAYFNISMRKDSEGKSISDAHPSAYPLVADSAKRIGSKDWQMYWLDSGDRVHIRHQNGANLLYMDGHTEHLSALQIKNADYGYSFGICYTPNL